MKMKILLQRLVSWCGEQGKEYEEKIYLDNAFSLSIIIKTKNENRKIILQNMGESIFISCDICKISVDKVNKAINLCAEMNENDFVSCSIRKNENDTILEITSYVSVKSYDVCITVIKEIEKIIEQNLEQIKSLC